MPGRAAIYLDNAATTCPLPEVVARMADAHTNCFGNPSSPHGFGAAAQRSLTDAREFLRGTVAASSLVFTSGGSEADALGIVGSAATRPPGRVLMASSDHLAILRTDQWLARFRHHITVLPVTQDGDVAPEVLFDALGPDVRTVALMYGHNELGTLCRLAELVELVRRVARDAHIHVDLVQTYGKLPFTFDDFDVDSIAVAGHKFHGPRGIGFLALAGETKLQALQPAGGQEHGLRGGTENVAGAVGMAVAAEHCLGHHRAIASHTEALAQWLQQRLQRELPQVERLGHPDRRLPHILSLRLPGIVGSTLQQRCDARGLAFSTGSACHGSGEPPSAPTRRRDEAPARNHVLAAIGMNQRMANEVIRLSFSGQNTHREVEQAADILIAEALTLLQQAPRQPAPGKTAARSQPQ